jgi:hypothetical protein
MPPARFYSVPKILLFEDKLGVSDGYQSIWTTLLLGVGILANDVYRRNAYRTFRNYQLLIRQGNRVSPGFNTDEQIQAMLTDWVRTEVNNVNPDLILVWDPAIYFLMNPEWAQATPDNMRGGVYQLFGIPAVCTLPISAWNTKKSEKDIARLNDGFTDKDEWLEDQEDESDDDENGTTAIWMEPVSVPYGKFVLRRDLEKAKRVMDRHINKKELTL